MRRIFDIEKVSDMFPMEYGRLMKQLNKEYRFSDGKIMSVRQRIESFDKIVKSTGDGMIDYNRNYFNRLDHKEQEAYIARLKAKTYYYINDWQVPKIVWDIVVDESDSV